MTADTFARKQQSRVLINGEAMTERRHKDVTLLRIAYWVGAVFDALTLVPMLVPGVGTSIFGMKDFVPSPAYQYAMTLAAASMLGWTALLVWADREPIERRGVLLLTVLVVVGLAGAGGYAVASGVIAFYRMLPTWICQAVLSGYFLFAHRRSGGLGRQESRS
jgi:hypothetical protein